METIFVSVLKHDGSEYRRWRGTIARRQDPLIVLDAEFETDAFHDLLGHIPRGSRTTEYYWLDRWYNVFKFLDHSGAARLWYCNINTPPQLAGNVLTYVDLDIDVIVQPSFSFQVLDTEEFEANGRRYGYSAREKAGAHEGVAELISLIDRREFPFVCAPDQSNGAIQPSSPEVR